MFQFKSQMTMRPGIYKEEEAWRNGDVDSAFRMVQVPGWDRYRDNLGEQLLKNHGAEVTAYAAVTQDQFRTMVDGKDQTIGFYQTEAEARKQAADGMSIISVTIRPFMIFMLGRPGEIVCRTDYLSFQSMQLIFLMKPAGDTGRILV